MVEIVLENQNNRWKKFGNMTIRRNCCPSLGDCKEQNFENILDQYHDEFAILYENESHVYAAVDRIRSIPIFYMLYENVFYISDSIFELAARKEKNTHNQRAMQEMKEAAYVTGHETILENIKALLPGEYVTYDKTAKIYYVTEYFSYGKAKPVVCPEKKLIHEMKVLHREVFSDLKKELNGRQAVIPLSGGYDSRLLLHMLCMLGHENLLCFTYGKEQNAEAVVSKEIAEKYRVPWEFVLYTPEKMRRMVSSESYKDYLRMSCNGISASHMQDFLAVEELHAKGLIEKDAVFIPGHAYDFLAGTHISDALSEMGGTVSKQTVIDEIISKNYNHIKANTPGREEWILGELGNEGEFYDSVGMYHFWEWKERQAKYIANSVRVYEYFGYEWKLPFWDRRMIEFWDRIPVEQRKGRSVFFKYMKEAGLKTRSANDRIFMQARSRIPFKLRIFLYRIKELRNNPLEFYSIFSGKQKLRFLLGKWDFIEKIVEDDLKYFWESVHGEEE